MQHYHFDNLTDYHDFLGLPAPEHPLFSLSVMRSDVDKSLACSLDNVTISTDFYAISLKHIISGAIHYGRTQYDFKNGSLLCLAPRQAVHVQGVRAKNKA